MAQGDEGEGIVVPGWLIYLGRKMSIPDYRGIRDQHCLIIHDF